MDPKDTTIGQTRRNRLQPYTAAERRLNKIVVFNDADPIVTRHLERGLSRKLYGTKASK